MKRGPSREPTAGQDTLFPDACREPAAQEPRTARILTITPAEAPASVGEPRPVDPASVFLTALEVIARYGWGRTKGYRMLRSEGFPRPIGGDRYRLDTVVAWESAQLTAARPTKPVPQLPARKRARVS